MATIYSRFCTYRQAQYSILRILQNEAIASMEIFGDVLDVGGIKDLKKGAKNFATGYTSWAYLNIDPTCHPDYLADLNLPLPIKDNFFDTVLCMNALEHILNINLTITEMFRVLKPNGKLIISVPFIFQIHGAPDDYHRPTASWYRETLLRIGFKKNNILITPLIIDDYISKLSLFDNPLSQRLRFIFRNIFFLPTILGMTNKDSSLCPVGYFIVASK